MIFSPRHGEVNDRRYLGRDVVERERRYQADGGIRCSSADNGEVRVLGLFRFGEPVEAAGERGEPTFIPELIQTGFRLAMNGRNSIGRRNRRGNPLFLVI